MTKRTLTLGGAGESDAITVQMLRYSKAKRQLRKALQNDNQNRAFKMQMKMDEAEIRMIAAGAFGINYAAVPQNLSAVVRRQYEARVLDAQEQVRELDDTEESDPVSPVKRRRLSLGD
jgi:hypothetical protein